MTSDVVLTAALRNNLLSLQSTQGLIDTTQFRLATGLKVNSALDNPQSFFASRALNNRAADLQRLLNGLGQSIQTIKAADNGITALSGLLDQADSVAEAAQTALAQGSSEARLGGNVDLEGNTDLTALSNVDAGNIITITVTDPAVPTPPSINAQPITLAAGTSTEELITMINDLDDGLSEPVIEASLNSEGKLEIKTLNGGNLRIEFDAAGAGGGGTDAEDVAFAAALGFGELVATEGDGAGTNVTSATASGNATINSIALYDSNTGNIASASTLIADLEDSGGTAFAGIDNAGDELTIEINGDASLSTTIELFQDAGGTNQTIQHIVDQINNDSAVNGLIEASFNTETGQIELRSIDSSVNSVQFTTADGGGAATQTNFGFGTGRADSATTTPNTASEIVHFGSAAGELADLEDQYNTIRSQIDELVGNGDTAYRGVNLLNGDSITTYFNENRSSTLTSTGRTFDSAGLGLNEADFANQTAIDLHMDEIRAALEDVRSFGTSLANDLNIIETRQQFTSSLINTLNEGADKLTLADQNEEGAKLLALQTRQQLGVTSLALASQSQQSILRLF